MSVQTAFNSFASALELEDDEKDYAVECHEKAFDALTALPKWKRDFISGSYGRNTRLTPLDDVDVIIVCADADAWDDDPVRALEACRDLLKPVFPGARTRRGAHAMKIYPLDATTGGFHLDIVVALPSGEGGTMLRITEPEGDTGWLRSDPEAHAKALTERNAAWEERVVPAVKMLKSWNRNEGEVLKSFHLEALVLRVLASKGDLKYPELIEALFKAMADAVLTPTTNPAVPDGYVDDELTNDERRAIRRKLNAAADAASKAVQARGDDEIRAQQLWHDLFGDPFPAPSDDDRKQALAEAIRTRTAKVGTAGVLISGTAPGRVPIPTRSFGEHGGEDADA